MVSNGMSLRKLATVLGVSQPFLSQIRAGKRPLPEALKRKVEALDAYHLLITDNHFGNATGDGGAGHQERPPSRMASIESEAVLAGVRGSRTHLSRSSRGTTDLKSPSQAQMMLILCYHSFFRIDAPRALALKRYASTKATLQGS